MDLLCDFQKISMNHYYILISFQYNVGSSLTNQFAINRIVIIINVIVHGKIKGIIG